MIAHLHPADRRHAGPHARRSPSRSSISSSSTRRTTSTALFIVAGLQLRRQRPEPRASAFVHLKDWNDRHGDAEQRPGDRPARDGGLLAGSATPRSSPWCRRRCSDSAAHPASTWSWRTAPASATTGLVGGAEPAAAAWPPRIRMLDGVRPNGLPDTPQLHVDIDQTQGRRARVCRIADINDTLSSAPGAALSSTTSSTAAGSSASTCRATRRSACSPEDLDRWYVRNAAGNMAPFSAFATTQLDHRPVQLDALQRRSRRSRSRASRRRARAPARR